MNKWIGTGRLGQDPEVKYLSSGSTVGSFSIAVTKKVNGKEQTNWINIVCWNKLAEIAAQYLNKGSRVLIEGELNTNKYEDKNGNKMTSFKITCHNLEFIDLPKKDQNYSPGTFSQGNNNNSLPPQNNFKNTSSDFSVDDIPF